MPRKKTPTQRERQARNGERDEAVREMRAGLDLPADPEKTPQALHHYRIGDQLEELAKLRGSDAEGDDIGFMNRVLAVCALPRTSQGNTRMFVRRTGRYLLTLNAMDPDYGLPYGTYPRLMFAWMCTEVVRTQSPRLRLGRSFAEFMRTLGVWASDSGGRWGVRTRLRDQINRLFACSVT